MNLEKILEEWKKDCVIEESSLETASLNTPMLHAKYLQLLSHAKLRLKDSEFTQKKLMKQKWLWYNGKMSQVEVERLGWDPDPFDGLKIMKGDMEHYIEADPELVESEAKVQYNKTIIETLKEIVDTIRWRHQTIKNIIENRKFEAGF